MLMNLGALNPSFKAIVNGKVLRNTLCISLL